MKAATAIVEKSTFKFETKTLDVTNNRISYNIRKRSNGKTIILQHGAFMNNLTMMGLAQLFKTYTVVVPDMAQHGKSKSNEKITSAERLAEIEYEFIKGLKENGEIPTGDEVTYAGWSLGGSMGQLMALKDPVFEKLVLISSAPVWPTLPSLSEEDKPNFDQIFKSVVNGALSVDTTPDRRTWVNDNYDSMLSPDEISMNDINICRKFDIVDKLGCITMPVLIIVGANDDLAIADSEIKLVKNLKYSKLVMISGEAHAMVIGCPEKVYREIVSFAEN